MKTLTEEQIQKGLDEAYKEAGHNAYFGNGFKLGVAFALKNLNGETVKREKACGTFFSDPFINEYKCLNCGKMKSEHSKID